MLSEKLVEPEYCCALLDDQEGMEEIAELVAESSNTVHYICSAQLYDQLFRYVRRKLLAGFSCAFIQSELQKLNSGDTNCELFNLFMLETSDTTKSHGVLSSPCINTKE